MGRVLNFNGKWRSYQKRILDSLEFHLMDKKLHIVAAPGAGKTTLGIEVVSRINRTTLVLCPTNTIKNQWKERICSSFLEPKDYEAVSTDIRNPKTITIITYQALLAAFTGAVEEDGQSVDNDEEEVSESISSSKRFNPSKAEEIIKILKEAGVSLLCFDEAHHLRKEWWKALTYLVEELKPQQSISLTATPPYDVEYSEWERYEELCGPIDEVISIPELVQNGDLCPHQDFVYLSNLRDNEKDLLRKYNNNVAQLLNKLLSDAPLITYISRLSVLNPTEDDVEAIFDNPEFYVSMASLLARSGVKIPKKFLKLFNATQIEVPKFNLVQARAFLNGFLITHSHLFIDLQTKVTEYYNLAKHLGLVQNKRIVLNESTKIQKQIANSLGKLDSIVDIVGIETKALANSLRMVILTDYIKADDVDNSHLGVVPIWRTLKTKYGSDLRLGVLCGSLILIQADIVDEFERLLDENSIDKTSVSITQYKEDNSFVKVTPKGNVKNYIVSLITEMFNRGYIRILVGTQALLGEGWDAPCINSLILSSTVSSYMLSNQMRGRAIRKDRNNPDKISNIWHLASIKITKKSDLVENELFKKTLSDIDFEATNSNLYDIEQLEKRFEGFEAPSCFGKHEITNGFHRVLSQQFFMNIQTLGAQAIDIQNDFASKLAQDRQQTKKWWNDALYLGYGNATMSLSTGVEAKKMAVKSLTYKGYKDVVNTILFSALPYLFSIVSFDNTNQMLFYLLLVTIGVAIALLVVFFKFLKTGSVVGVMKQIAIVMLETLAYLGYVKVSLKNVGITVMNTVDGVYVSCKNLPTEENNLLIKCMQEFLNPVENPRYLLIRKDSFAKVFRQVDYFAIPAIMSQRKQDVEIFEMLWKKYIGGADIVYTRNLEGRKLLLTARKSAFSSNMREKSKKISKWQ